MISLGAFMPEYFNQNGDQGNIEVLGMQLMWREIECQVVTGDLEQVDFLLVGDASRAAMREFEGELLALIPLLENRLSEGLPTLLVGSAHEFYAGKVAGLRKLTPAARASEFREASDAGVAAFGYRNSEFKEDLFVSGGFASTSLFGPVLGKSPKLLELMLAKLGVSDSLPAGLASELDELVVEIRRRAIAG